MNARWRWQAGLVVLAMLTAGVAQAGPEVSVGFYDALAPHGEWLTVRSYGTVWRPYARMVGDDFMPYSSGGHWEFTEYGWTWESDYAWGWVPFHHGRWVFDDDYGWVWIPDDVWGPAWVEWRVGGGYVGWVPLGPPGFEVGINTYRPRWAWVHTDHFRDRDFHHHRVSDDRDRDEAFHLAVPVPPIQQQAPRGPEPRLVAPPGVPVPVVTITPRRLQPGAIRSERRLVPAPPSPSRPLAPPPPPPAGRPPEPERQRPMAPPPPPPRQIEPERQRPMAPPPPRQIEPERQRPMAPPPPRQVEPERQRPMAPPPPRQLQPPAESPEAEQARKKAKEKPKSEQPGVPGPPRGKPRPK